MRNSEIGKEVIKKQLSLIPKLPGVYKMLSINNEILYYRIRLLFLWF